MPLLKIEPPRLEGLGLKGKVERLGDWTRQLTEQLRFLFGHLSGENLNGTGFDLEIRSQDTGESLGHLGAVPGGVGLRSGAVILRVNAAGVQISQDNGKTWEEAGS